MQHQSIQHIFSHAQNEFNTSRQFIVFSYKPYAPFPELIHVIYVSEIHKLLSLITHFNNIIFLSTIDTIV